MSEFEDTKTTIKALFKDLDLSESTDIRAIRNLKNECAGFLDLSEDKFLQVGFDAATVLGVSGDWELALAIAQRLVELGDDRIEIKLWQLRCLIELERHAEAIALSTSNRWHPDLIIHVNYLTGLGFEALGMFEKARLRFDAVSRVDASYRSVAQKLINY